MSELRSPGLLRLEAAGAQQMLLSRPSAGRLAVNFPLKRFRLADPRMGQAEAAQVEDIFDRPLLEQRPAPDLGRSQETKGDDKMGKRQDRGQAMEQPRQSEFTADEFIAWALEQPTGRFELSNGHVVAMAPERASHNQAKLNAAIALRGAIGARGIPCRVMTDGMAVRIDDLTVYEPDALVRCGSPLPGDAIEVVDPIVVVEVVSPSSRGVDRGVKLASYFSLPSVRHYVIVDVDRRVVIHHWRGEEGTIAAEILFDGSLALYPPGLEIDIRDVFDGI